MDKKRSACKWRIALTGADMSFAQIALHYDDVSATFLVPANEASDEVLRTAF